MGWTYKDPLTFPAIYPQTLRAAAASLETPIPMFTGSYHQLEAYADRFRFFTFCLRKNPKVLLSLFNLLQTYDFRTSIRPVEDSFVLSLTAKPNRLSDLLLLNPHLELEKIS